jgi:Tfp pilus assembly protein PilF
MNSRTEAIREMLAADPSNSFLRYGLAMDLLNSGDAAQSIVEFETLIENDASYAAAYFHGGRALERLARIDDAREMYRRGIAAAQAKGDAHTAGELEGALAMLG